MRYKITFITLITLILTVSAGASGKPDLNHSSPQSLTLAFIPQENPEKLLGDIEIITEYLSNFTGLSIKGFVTQDQAAAVEALKNETADVSFMGALPYVIAHHYIAAEVLLAELYRGKPNYKGRIFVRKDSGITEINQLRGKTIAFTDPLSESGYLYPLEIFTKEGLLSRDEDPENFFSSVYFAGGYQQAIQAVANGFVDAAGASQFAELLLSPDQFANIRWIAESELIPSHAVITRSKLDPELKTLFRNAMLSLNKPENQHLLSHVYSPDGYISVDHDSYTGVEAIARLYKIIK